ncbi:ABC transporter permease [bacterium AH-315-G05]|jgi:simple sugar transport system permease protein|nr:ABC transporter permease [bacterium AH-315-G05]
MMERINEFYKNFGLPRLIIASFLILLCIAAAMVGLPLPALFSAVLVRFGMHGVLVLAMVPAIIAGIGLNFGLPLGILCGLLGGLISIELDLVGFNALATAILIAIPLAMLVGVAYGWLLNRVKGSEMMVATYVGFSAVSLMSIGWLLLPLYSPEIVWPIGRGIRTTIVLTGRYDKVLNNFLDFSIFGMHIPTGLLLFMLMICFLMWLFLRSSVGVAMKATGDNPRFATASGINVNKSRMIGTILSTVLGAVGIIVFSQSFGFIQLYQAPMFMGFGAVAAILIGGASVKKASITNVLIGTLLFQGMLVISLPVANKIMTLGSLAEISRIIISNGIILYALTQVSGGE